MEGHFQYGFPFDPIIIRVKLTDDVGYKNLSSQAYVHIFSANFAADFCIVYTAEHCDFKIMPANPRTFLMKTGSKIDFDNCIFFDFILDK